VASSAEAIQMSPAHIYLSALPFAPKDSLIYELFSPLCIGTISVQTFGVDRHDGGLAMTLWGHDDGPVELVAYTADGCIISNSRDGTLCTWDTKTGDEAIDPLKIDSWAAQCFAVARSGKCLVFGSVTGAVGIWDLVGPTQHARRLLGHSDVVTSVDISHNGDLVASSSEDRTVRIWSVKTGQQLTGMDFQTNFVHFVVLSPDGEMLACGFYDGTARLWNGITSKPAEVHILDFKSFVGSIRFSPNSLRLAVGLSDATISLWDVSTGEEIATIRGHSRSIQSIQFSPDGAYLVSASEDSTVRLWDINQDIIDSPVAVWTGHEGAFYSATFSPDGRYIATTFGDHTIQIWDASIVNQAASPFQGHHSHINSVTVSADGALVVSGSEDRSVRVWDTQTGEPKLPPLLGHKSTVLSVAISSTTNLIASGSDDGTVQLWSSQTGTPVDEPMVFTNRISTAVTFSPDGRWIACATAGDNVYIWGVGARQLPNLNPLHCDGWVTAVAFSPDSRIIAASDGPGSIHFWDVDSGQRVREPLQNNGETAHWLPIAFSPSGTHILCGINFIGRMWDIGTGKEVIIFRQNWDQITSISYSSNGLVIATGSINLTVRLWAADTGIQRAVLRGHMSRVTSVAFAPDGRSIVSGSEDSTIRIWDVEAACLSGLGVEENPAAAVEARGIRDGWLYGEQGELLLWVPKDYRAYLDLPSCRLLIARHKVVIKVEGDWYHGPDWTKCWIGPALL